MLKQKSIKIIDFNILAIIMIIIAELCFYTASSINLYLILSLSGILLSLIYNLKYATFRIRKNSFIFYIFSILLIFLFNGVFLLQAGIFSVSKTIFRMMECIFLYISISSVIKEYSILKLSLPFSVAGLFTAVFLFFKEKDNILLGGIRIGDSLSGNSNTIGYSFGIISLLLIWSYFQKKSKVKLTLYVIFVSFLLLTGSKKGIILLISELFIYIYYDNKSLTKFLKLIIIIIILYYIIFRTQYFYDIIGIRLYSMLVTITGKPSSELYSYSTDIREKLIYEAFKIFSKKPIFGGGWNYFYANTIYRYDYSHCNYLEILCSFGIVGLLLYYSKHINCIRIAINFMKENKYTKELVFVLVLLAVSLVLDWTVVSFSAQCIWYLPIIISSAIIDQILSGNIRSKNE